MKYYQTNEFGALVGEGEARANPLEPGKFLIPGGAVTAPPPVLQAGEIAVHNGNAWEKRQDKRGKYWTADGQEKEVKHLGEEPAAGWLNAKPQPTQAELDELHNAQVKAELLELDLLSIRALREYIAAKADAPQILKDREAAALAKRGTLK